MTSIEMSATTWERGVSELCWKDFETESILSTTSYLHGIICPKSSMGGSNNSEFPLWLEIKLLPLIIRKKSFVSGLRRHLRCHISLLGETLSIFSSENFLIWKNSISSERNTYFNYIICHILDKGINYTYYIWKFGNLKKLK